MLKPIVKYVVFIDGVREDSYEKFKDAQFDAQNYSCFEHRVYREVDGVLGKCLERRCEADEY